MTIYELKSHILSRSIHEDQEAVITQWMKTFIHNKDDAAIKLGKLLFASVYQGDFKTRSSLAGQTEHSNPNNHLTCIDYLSHGSRIILDYEQLSPENQIEFLQYFPDPSEENEIYPRTSSHAIVRINRVIIEKKGFYLGVQGFVLSFVAKRYDFGVNIAMGGAEQTNFVGKKILANGCSGHMYFHRYDDECLVMCGLEQNAPPQSAYETFQSLLQTVTMNHSESIDLQTGTDQFGQWHSLTGASDTYTAAGSLYFSDPVYQAKLLLEKGCFAPDKYGAMIVILTNENWAMIKESIRSLEKIISDGEEAALSDMLHTFPKNASAEEQPIPSYIAFMFDAYLTRVYEELITPSELLPHEKESIHQLQQQLLDSITQIKQDKHDLYLHFLAISQEILERIDAPIPYKESIQRIKDLFKLQFKKNPEPFMIHLKEQSDQIQNRINQLYREVSVVREQIETTVTLRDEHLSSYLSRLTELQQSLLNFIKKTTDTTESVEQKYEIDPEQLMSLQQLISKTELMLSQMPKPSLDPSIQEPVAKIDESMTLANSRSSSSFFKSTEGHEPPIDKLNRLSKEEVVYSPVPITITA